jgi:hypothetical protein
MSSGGSQTSASTPWGPASPYLLDIMQKAQQQYGTTAGQYKNPAGNFGYGQATGAVGDAIGGTTPYGSLAANLTPETQAAIKSQLSGTPDYSAVHGALDAANQQTWDSFNNQELPQLNQRASFLGNPSGAIKDLNWATANIGRNMDLNAQQQYLQQYNLAQDRQANAMGLGANIAQGAAGQQLQGANLYQSLSQMPQTNLADYAALVSGTGGKFGTDTTKMNAGAGQTAANVIGGLTAGAGLVNSLFGGSSGTGGAVGAIGRAFGAGGTGAAVDTAGIGSMAGDAATAAGSGASAGMANTAADVAASNSAYFGGAGAAGAGAAAASAPALATIGTSAVAPAADAAAASAAAALGGGSAAGGGGAGATGAGLGAGAGGAAAIGIAAIPALLAATVKEHPFDAAYNQRMLSGLNAKPGTAEYNAATQQIIAMYAGGYTHMDQLAPEVLQKARQLGLDKSGAAIRQAQAIAQTMPGLRSAAGKTYGVRQNRY